MVYVAGNQLKNKSLSLPLPSSEQDSVKKTPLSRTKSNIPGISVSQETDQHVKSSVPKSCSVENVADSYYRSAPAPRPNYGLWNPPYSAGMYGDQGHVAVAKRLSDPESSPAHVDVSVNLHRKLQRQLTLNPSCDPRLQMHLLPSSSQPHHPVTRHNSGGPSGMYRHIHQNVTRIASAPDSYRPWPPVPPPHPNRHMHRLGSTSDPQLNLCVPPSEAALLSEHFDTSMWPPAMSAPPPSVVWPPQTSHMPPPPYPANTEDVRRRIHYHLASIFPEEQVQNAMQLYPDETDPQKICAAILAMSTKP